VSWIDSEAAVFARRGCFCVNNTIQIYCSLDSNSPNNSQSDMAEVSVPPIPSDVMQGVEATGTPAEAPTETPGVEEPEYTSETLYIQNLNEKIKIDGHYLVISIQWDWCLISFSVLKASLRGLFKSYGEVLDVVAHNNLRMRGQAFVSFASADVAKKAMKEVRGFPLYSKPMVCGLPITAN